MEKLGHNIMEICFMILDRIIQNFGGFTILMMAIALLYAVYQSHNHNHLDWVDLVRSKGTHSVSLTKFLQLIGGITGTWMVVYTTLHDKLTYDLLLVYLAYVGAIDGWSKFVSARYGFNRNESTTTEKNDEVKK